MLMLVSYDVNTVNAAGRRRLRRVAKLCENWGIRVQNSVFECVLTETQFVILKNQLKGIIDEKQDSVRFYLLGNNWKRRIETIGKNFGMDFTGELII